VIIVGGRFEVDPAQRDAFIAERLGVMRASRDEEGCLEYTFAADPLEAAGVILFERWESQAALDAHLAALVRNTTITPQWSSVKIYDVAGERRLER
jgi:quinol monooxygenase YgiN